MLHSLLQFSPKEMRTPLLLQVTEVQFDFDDDVDEETVAMALVEEVTDYTGWCVCSLDFVHVLNTH